MNAFFSSFTRIFKSKPYTIPFLPKDLTGHYKNEISECFLDKVYIATKYMYIEDLLHRFKYQSQREVWSDFLPLFVQLLEQNFSKEIIQKTVFIPLPMHWSRYFSRGFDHIYWISSRLAKIFHSKNDSLLSTPFFSFAFRQSHLSREKRLANKRNHFKIKSHQKIPETVFLIDDVISTGSSVNECARVLKSAGVKRVIGVFLASNQ